LWESTVADLDRMLRDTLHRHADEAPSAATLLTAVHQRSRRLARRRRQLAVAGVAAAVALAGVVWPVLAGVGRSAGRPAVDSPAAPPSPAPTAPSASSSVDARPPLAPPVGTPTSVAVVLGHPTYSVPSFPYQPGTTPVGGLAAPIVTLQAGRLQAYYYAKDPVRGADVRVTVSPTRPTFANPAGPVREAPEQVRGHAGTLRTVDVSPAKQLSLYWQESSARWVRVDTDDTLTDNEVVQFADTMSAASVPLVMPFRLGLAPVGMELDTVTRSELAFRPVVEPSGTGAPLTCTLVAHQPVHGTKVSVGANQGGLTRTAAGVSLAVALDADRTLLLQVPAHYQISDTDLVRLAAEVAVTDEAVPQGD
jgi:hypothetical protein